MFLEILSKFKLALYYLINTCLKIATSRSYCTSRNFFYISEVEFEMDKKKEASRKCLALEGKMDAFGDENELKDLWHDCYP